MKRFILLIAVVSVHHLLAFAQKKYEMVIEKTNGTNVIIKTDDIVRTYFRERKEEDNSETSVESLKAVDLGLPSGTKWANKNIGLSDANPFGSYYSWGEVNEKVTYYWEDYHYGKSQNDVVNIGTDIAGTEYDVAHKLLGGSWIMPTLEDMEELLRNCIFQWTIQNGQKGGLFTSRRNGNSIFLPAGGAWWDGALHESEKSGNYWASTLDASKPYCAVTLYFDKDGADVACPAPRHDGNNIRPVCR